ncbi:MAG TPA: Rrf2 family transcriptional regulator [Pyrinomonadaceae bacterium]|nr:Rrf2 family transcriptional regulator [Pyrinomonadaceae bacterium]
MPASSSRFAVAVHILTLMAAAGDEPLKSEFVACSVNTNAVVIRRLLCALARARLVTSQTGSCGGSRLARSSSRITLLDVYRATEAREVFALHRQPPRRSCPVGGNIQTVLESVLEEVEQSVERVLGKITIKQILENVKPPAAASGRKQQASRWANQTVLKGQKRC